MGQKIELSNITELPYMVDEAINRLRINVGFFGKDIKKIMVVSSEPNEGKSFVSFRLWKQMAEIGESVCLLDMDLRNSVAIERYDVKSTDEKKLIGTSQYLASDANLEDALMETPYENASVMLNVENVVNPSMLIESDKFKNLLNDLSDRFRYVFVDVPPLHLVSDAERIGSLCDGAILVVRSGVTPKSIVRKSIHQLERSGCPLLGIVLSRAEKENSGYYGKRYGKYGTYGYGYGEE